LAAKVKSPPTSVKSGEPHDHDHFDVDEDLDLSDLGPEAPTNPDLASALTAAVAAVSAPGQKPVTASAPPVASAVKPPAMTAPAKPSAMLQAPPLPLISKPAATVQPPRPAATGGPDGGLSDQKIKAIYDAYVMAKRRCGEDTSKLSLNAVADTLKKQVPALMKQHSAKSVEFKVVIKDGKAVLRALPKD
jgi:hypothetical protein